MHVTIGIIALNEEEYLARNLAQHYPLADRIVVVEGADQLYPRERVTRDGLSTDATAEIVRSFPDPDHKLKFVQHGFTRRGGDQAKCELRNRYMQDIEPGLLVVIDADEFYRRGDLLKIIQYARRRPVLQSLAYPPLNFWRTDAQFITGGYYNVVHTRFWRVAGGESYNRSHNVPERKGVLLTRFPRLRVEPKFVPHEGGYKSAKICCFHYGFCKSAENTRDKTDYYLNRGEAKTHAQTTRSRAAWFGDDSRLPAGLLIRPYAGPLPEVMQKDSPKPADAR